MADHETFLATCRLVWARSDWLILGKLAGGSLKLVADLEPMGVVEKEQIRKQPWLF
jgi:hypothetical protein